MRFSSMAPRYACPIAPRCAGSIRRHPISIGESHWPLLRIVVAHDLYSGLAMRPQWGPDQWQRAVSEQGLLEQAIDRLPAGASCWEMRILGCFRWPMRRSRRSHPAVLRLTMRASQGSGQESCGMAWIGASAGGRRDHDRQKPSRICPPTPASKDG